MVAGCRSPPPSAGPSPSSSSSSPLRSTTRSTPRARARVRRSVTRPTSWSRRRCAQRNSRASTATPAKMRSRPGPAGTGARSRWSPGRRRRWTPPASPRSVSAPVVSSGQTTRRRLPSPRGGRGVRWHARSSPESAHDAYPGCRGRHGARPHHGDQLTACSCSSSRAACSYAPVGVPGTDVSDPVVAHVGHEVRAGLGEPVGGPDGTSGSALPWNSTLPGRRAPPRGRAARAGRTRCPLAAGRR